MLILIFFDSIEETWYVRHGTSSNLESLSEEGRVAQ